MKPQNASQGPNDLVRVFGRCITLPQKYETVEDVAMNSVAVLCFFSLIINAVFLLTIIRDPFNKLRTITAIILGFTSATNVFKSLLLFIDNVLHWARLPLSPKLIICLGVFSTTLYCICNFLHTVNIYGAIVLPVRYAVLEPKIRRVLLKFLSLTGVIILLVNIIPLYTLPDNTICSYFKAVLTLDCVQLVLLAVVFAYLYTKVFQTLYSQRQKFTLAYHLKRSTVRGKRIKKKNHEIVKTLLIHVLCFMITTVPGSIISIIFLHCNECDRSTLYLVHVWTDPLRYSTFIIQPVLWLMRLNSYKHAMKETLTRSLCFWRRRSEIADTGRSLNLERKPISTDTKDFV